MYIDNNYFEEKDEMIGLIERYFKRYPLDVANIARLYWELVEGADDTEQLIISEIVFYHTIWKIANGLPTSGIQSVKRCTNEILRFNQTFTLLSADEYKDFIKMVEELNVAEIDILCDNG